MGVASLIARQRGYLFPWVPVALGAGIGLYFALPLEPPLWALRALLGAAALALGAGVALRQGSGPLVIALGLILFGLGWAGLRAQRVAAPVLEFRYYGPIEGRLIKIDRNASDRPRLTLDQVILHDTAPVRTPNRVRLSLHDPRPLGAPIGARVILTGHLSPPMGPAEPGGFDFRRLAWFETLGAVGYSRTPVLILAPPQGRSAWLALTDLRLRIAAGVRARIPGQPGALAAVVLTGDRSGLDQPSLEAMRGSNLAHLLAISGLHMGLLTGAVFVALRSAIALWPWLALRVDGRKWAALVSFGAALAYLGLSGGSVATQRAFVMVAVMLVAVLSDRRAITLRAVAVAAILILLWRPESLMSAGFQMSFAATTMLVWVFAQMRDQALWRGPRWLRPALTLVIASTVAGAATAPFGAAHFNQWSQLGLLANLLAVPLMGTLVMPAAVAAALLAPLGLAGPALWLMGLGCGWILSIAHWITGFGIAVRPILAPDPWVLPMIVGGMLLVVLWQGWARLTGLLPALAALWLWLGTERPPVLIASSGGLIGVLGAEGRVLSKPKGDGFAAARWLEKDGDRRAQAEAAAPGPLIWEGRRIGQLSKARLAKAQDPCAGLDLLVTQGTAEGALPCQVIDAAALRRGGAHALWQMEGQMRIVTAQERAGQRLWSDRGLARAARDRAQKQAQKQRQGQDQLRARRAGALGSGIWALWRDSPATGAALGLLRPGPEARPQ